jgi:quinol monooxygenase YgiN
VVPLDPEHREGALETTRETAERSRGEPGVIDYRASTGVERPTLLRFVERCGDAAAPGAHLRTDHSVAFEEAVIEGTPERHRFEAEPGPTARPLASRPPPL